MPKVIVAWSDTSVSDGEVLQVLRDAVGEFATRRRNARAYVFERYPAMQTSRVHLKVAEVTQRVRIADMLHFVVSDEKPNQAPVIQFPGVLLPFGYNPIAGLWFTSVEIWRRGNKTSREFQIRQDILSDTERYYLVENAGGPPPSDGTSPFRYVAGSERERPEDVALFLGEMLAREDGDCRSKTYGTPVRKEDSL